MCMGGGAPPQAVFVTSEMHGGVPRLFFEDPVGANSMLERIRARDPYVAFVNPAGVTTITFQTFSETSDQRTMWYDQTPKVRDLGIIQKDGSELSRTVDWASQE